jgi:hypothetical protein
MRPFFHPLTTAAAVAAMTLLSGCAGPPRAPNGQVEASPADQQALAACRARADEVYDQQNRAAIYTPTTGQDTPRSGQYAWGVTSRGLSALYAHDNMIDDCLRHRDDAAPGADTAVQTIPTTQPPVDQPAPPQ